MEAVNTRNWDERRKARREAQAAKRAGFLKKLDVARFDRDEKADEADEWRFISCALGYIACGELLIIVALASIISGLV